MRDQCIARCACFRPSFRWYSLHLPTERWLAEWVDVNGWLHIEMVYRLHTFIHRSSGSVWHDECQTIFKGDPRSKISSGFARCTVQVRHFESCFQSSDDKRRIRVLEEDLKMAKEVSVRLHEELERLETKRTKAQEELERTKRLLDESEDRRLSLQKEVNSVTNEVRL